MTICGGSRRSAQRPSASAPEMRRPRRRSPSAPAAPPSPRSPQARSRSAGFSRRRCRRRVGTPQRAAAARRGVGAASPSGQRDREGRAAADPRGEPTGWSSACAKRRTMARPRPKPLSPGESAVRALELLKDRLAPLLGNARPGVADLDDASLAARAARRPARRRAGVAQRVGEQVLQDAAQHAAGRSAPCGARRKCAASARASAAKWREFARQRLHHVVRARNRACPAASRRRRAWTGRAGCGSGLRASTRQRSTCSTSTPPPAPRRQFRRAPTGRAARR